MLELAPNYGEPQPLRLKDIADVHQIPQRFLVQILLQMKLSTLSIRKQSKYVPKRRASICARLAVNCQHPCEY